MIKIIIFDLDGTLFDSQKRINVRTIHKIIDLEKQGMIVGIATGRFYEELDEVIAQLKLKEYQGFVASSNGLEIHDFFDGEIKNFSRLSKIEVQELIEFSKHYHLISYVWQRNGYSMFHVSFLQGIKKIITSLPFHSHYIKTLRQTRFEKSIVLEKNEYDKVCFAGVHMQRFKRDVLKKFSLYRFYDLNDFGTELCKKDVGKLEAVKYICQKKKVSLEEVMAFGDGANDIYLLSSCGYGVAMKNGNRKIKKVTEHISDFTNNQQGVFNCLNSFFPEYTDLKE